MRSRPLLLSVLLAGAIVVASCGGDSAVVGEPRVATATPIGGFAGPVPTPEVVREGFEAYRPEVLAFAEVTTPVPASDEAQAFATALVGTWTANCGDDDQAVLASACQRLELAADGSYVWEETSDYLHFAYGGSWSAVAVAADEGQLVLQGASIAAVRVDDDRLEIFGDVLARTTPVAAELPNLDAVSLPDIGALLVDTDLRAMGGDTIAVAGVQQVKLRSDGTYTAVVDDACSSDGVWGLRVEVGDNERSGPTQRRLVLNDLHLCGVAAPTVNANVADPAAVRSALHAQVEVDVIDGQLFLSGAGYEDLRARSSAYAQVLPFRNDVGPSGWFSLDVPAVPDSVVEVRLRLVNEDRREQLVEQVVFTIDGASQVVPLDLVLQPGEGVSTTVEFDLPSPPDGADTVVVELRVEADTGSTEAAFDVLIGAS